MNSIRKLMSEKSIRFTDIQEKTGLSQSTLTRVLSKNGIPNSTKLETLKKIADVLGVSIVSLLLGIDSEIENEVRWLIAKKKISQMENEIKDIKKENNIN